MIRPVLAAALLCCACLRDPQTVGGLGGTGSSGGDSSGQSSTTVSGAMVRLKVRASDAPFAHTDGCAGQTPTDYFAGVRSLTLIDETGDDPDLIVFSVAPDYALASFNAGDETTIAEVAASSLPFGSFTRARVAVSHIEFQIAATGHVGAVGIPGTVDALQVLSDATVLEGDRRDRGFWSYVFTFADMQFPFGGSDGAPVPAPPAGGPVQFAVEGDETAIYFAVALLVDPGIDQDIDVVLDTNVSNSFRWQDQDEPGYLPDVFDARLQSFEPLCAVGVNSLALTFE